MPTLIIRGHLDFLFEKPMFEKVATAVPNAEDVDVGASGHLVMLERHDAVNRAIERVLEGPNTRSWRTDHHADEAAERGALLRQRPWLAHYEQDVPFTIAIPHVPLPFLLESAVRRFPRHMAIQSAGTGITYQQLDEAVNQFANALLALGLQKGERVMLLLPDLPQFIIAFYGTLKAGAVAVLTPPQTENSELLSQLQSTAAKILVTIYENSEIAGQMQKAGLVHVIFTRKQEWTVGVEAERTPLGQDQADVHHFTSLLEKQSNSAPEVSIADTELALIQYTSGTTGAAKGVMLSHRNLLANTLQTRHWIPTAQEGKERFLCALSFSHMYGLTTTLNVPLALGATLILEPGFDLARVLNAIKRYKPTIFSGVPGMYVAINNFPGVRKMGIESINLCISGSAPLPVEVQEGFEKLTKGRLVEGYGLTEAAPVTHANPLNGRRKVGTIGIPLPSTEATIFDLASGEPGMEAGQIGELAVRGPQVMLGYWQQPEATAQVLHKDGWLLTGDVAQMDPEGYFRIIARKADMWYPDRPSNATGEPAFPRDIEEVLYEVPQVKEAAVIAIANQPIAFVTTSADRPTAEALIAYCRRRLSPELVPRLVIFVEDFPRNFIGKILRKELVKRFEQLKQLSEFTTSD
ncbi:long-chain fatty acid--CoA ligase [soil metagenome]